MAKWMETDDVAKAIGKSRQWVHKLVGDGRLKWSSGLTPGEGMRPVVLVNSQSVLDYLRDDRKVDPESDEYKAAEKVVKAKAWSERQEKGDVIKHGVRLFDTEHTFDVYTTGVLERYANGESVIAMAEREGVSRQAVRNLLIAKGVPLRGVGEAVRLKRSQVKAAVESQADGA